ncbi:ZMIZ [Mytilus coruscus]|uniref:ZMIZ n=1 Tax=Mytilus coruscus TaxID=42192 RepID=A0A6J8AMR4_MYTCO|nr:ZMIZ [Mytilus coruscus]
MNEMERHIQQTIDRLSCIKQHLSSPSGFQNAARELLEWCSDLRAFQPPFEGSLISCLTIVSRVAAQPGYDLDLGYRLLAVCAAHREKLSSKSSALLSMWCEELGRLLLLRHQKNRTPDSKSPGMHSQLQNKMPPMPPMSGYVKTCDPNGPWCTGNQGQSGPGLSVVTTVWGMTNTTQTAPFNHQTPGYTTTMSSTNYTQQPNFQVNALQKGPYNPTSLSNNIPYRRPSYPPTPNTPGSNTPSNNDYPGAPQQGNPALAQALVAAAATASATATATATMMMQNDPQMNNNQPMNVQMNYGPGMQQQMPMGQYGNQYPPGMSQRHPGPMNMGPGPGAGPGPMMRNPMYTRRQAPYHNPHNPKMGTRPSFPNGPQYGDQYNNQQQYSGGKYPPTQQPLPSPTYHQQPGMRPNPGGPYPNMPNGQTYYNNPVGRPMPPQPQNFNYNMGQQGISSPPSNYPHSPLPGNPTPPITPGPGPNGYNGPMPNGPPMPIKKDPEELRLTFPVRDGVVSDLELQLKCFHHEDRQMNTNWPASVTVSVNANPLNIERGENKTSHKPLYLKDVCQPGRNTIQITVTACCCSHLFVLQLVHRPSVRSVLQGLLRKRLLPAEHCITKIKRNFSNVAPNSLNGEDGVEQTAIKVSLKCPITFRRITLPARGHECKHIQCFDLESYLQLNCERGSWRCPVCNKTALLEGLEIDQYIWGILTNLQTTEFEEVTIDPLAAWKPVQHKTIKEEEAESCSGRWIKAMSPSSMQLPTMNSWDVGRGPSPFTGNMPPSSQNMQGPPYSNMHNNDVMPNGGPSPMSYQHPATPGDYNNPLSHMSPPTSVEAMNSMNNVNIKSELHSSVDIQNHMNQYLPTVSDTTPLRHPDSSNINNCGTPSSQSQNQINGSQLNHGTPNGIQSNNSGADNNTIGDLSFDPSSVIDGEGQTPTLDLDLNLTDPMELLSYLGPSENSNNNSGSVTSGNTGNNQNSSNTTSSNNDDLLALFE